MLNPDEAGGGRRTAPPVTSTAASRSMLHATRTVCRPPEQKPITPTLPLELLSPRRYAAAPATSPITWESATPPPARAAAAASSGSAPGASRQ